MFTALGAGPKGRLFSGAAHSRLEVAEKVAQALQHGLQPQSGEQLGTKRCRLCTRLSPHLLVRLCRVRHMPLPLFWCRCRCADAVVRSGAGEHVRTPAVLRLHEVPAGGGDRLPVPGMLGAGGPEGDLFASCLVAVLLVELVKKKKKLLVWLRVLAVLMR